MKPKSLGNLEQEVMDIIWQYKKCTVRDVLNQLQNKKYAYTTIATILTRLYEKGIVTKKEGKEGYMYSPKVSKEFYSRNIAQSFLKNFISSFGDIAIASFAESIDKLPEQKRKYFIGLLEEYDKNK